MSYDADQLDLKKIKALRQSYNMFFTSEDGKIVLEDLKKVCFFNTTTINDSSNAMAFNEGQRAVVLHIISRMRLDTIKIEGEETK